MNVGGEIARLLVYEMIYFMKHENDLSSIQSILFNPPFLHVNLCNTSDETSQEQLGPHHYAKHYNLTLIMKEQL